jgi:hypothetical protein
MHLSIHKFLIAGFYASVSYAFAAGYTLRVDEATGGQGKFASAEILREATAKGLTVDESADALQVSIAISKEKNQTPQSYRIERDGKAIRVIAADANGAMYGGLDIAEAIRHDSLAALQSAEKKPHIAKRGIKFNIPLDLRTPSYTDTSDSGQANIPEVWQKDFWIEYLDSMARHRYNVLSLWSLHPFPSMVKVPEFPEVALDDVWRTRAKLDDKFSFLGNDFVRPEMLADHEIVKKITIDEKIDFWRWVMQQAADRGIQIYVFTWNVFTFGAEGKHGITDKMDNEITIKYFRASVREMVNTYPLLGGIGITAGEGMPHKMDSKIKEKWLWDTYGEGVRDALKTEPKRKFNMIHRFHWSAQGDILDAFKDYPGPFDFSFKYSVAHMYSIPNPPFIEPLMANMAPGMKTWLTVRNDDIYTFRFGDAAYAREYILNIPSEKKIAGFYMGPDGYCWGRDFLARNPVGGKRPLVMDKQWYSFMMWGRLAYDPSLPDSHFEKALASRHPQAASHELFSALHGAAQVMPLITRFFWGDIDLKWFPEACLSHRRSRGFYTVRHFMEGSTMPSSDVLSIRNWRKRLVDGKPMEETTPLEIAAALDGAASDTFASIAALRDAAKADPELGKNIIDCECLALLGRYYAAKIRSACALALYDSNGDAFEKESAIRQITAAQAHWKSYSSLRDANYLPGLYNRLGFVNLTELNEKVGEDIEIVQKWSPGNLKEDTKGGGTEKGFNK